ncbi:MAG TPA: hypothetical protein ACFYD7_10850 [Candidatus Wujingus californicus]|uniref:hypothetical protein n=1 Tax=Candidatus Wujingus californicus TaxID=3367618 RepID=UPI001D4EC36B|nr:hypothetical protein [Planctomycetota bacterium]MDO8095027.1 hypothetical protein [Candidatus Brocadiales bacterium]
MIGKLIINIFIGYQLKSPYHHKSDYRKIIHLLSENLGRQKPPIKILPQFCEFQAGTQLWEEVTSAINIADITVFDISENNPNVLVEVGIAKGNGKHVVLLKNEQAKKDHPLPSDLSPFIYLPYANAERLVSKRIVKGLSGAFTHFVKSKHDPRFYHRSLWALHPESRSLLIPGKIPEDWTGNRFEDYIRLRRFSDLDSLHLTFETLHRLYPTMEVIVQSANSLAELPSNWQEYNLILIGGPDFNPLVHEFEDRLPFEYKYGPAGSNEVWLMHKKTGKEYHPRFWRKNGKKRAIDYGFFAKAKVSKRSTTKLVFFGGARTWGVVGATMLASCVSLNRHGVEYRNARKLVERFGSDPSLVVPVEVSGSEDGIHASDWKIGSVELIA